MVLTYDLTVLNARTSWAAISRLERPAAMRRSTSNSRSVSGSSRGWGGGSRGGTFLNPFSAQQCEEPFDVGQGNGRRGGMRSFPRVFVELCEQDRHGWAFIHKDADIALRLSQR